MEKLNLPSYEFKIERENDKLRIWDGLRKKFISLTPEEWVRQNFIRYLINEKKFPAGLMAVEKKITVNGRPRRFDALVYSKSMEPLVILEFKSPDVKINNEVFEQIAMYNISCKVNYLIVSNGLVHYCCRLDSGNSSYFYLKDIPDYIDM